MKPVIYVLSLPVLLLTIACVSACTSETLDGGSNSTALAADGAVQYSCDNRAIESTCAEFPPGFPDAGAHCDGVLGNQRCPSDSAVGVCTVEADAGTLTNTYYASGPEPRTQQSARAICEGFFGGTFQPR